MKRIFLLATILLTVLLFWGCSQIQSTLDTPTDLRVTEDGYLRWNSVEGASGYIVSFDSYEEPQISTTQYDLYYADLVEGQTYEVTVRAVGDGYIHLSSEDSRPLQFTYKTPAAPEAPVTSSPSVTVVTSPVPSAPQNPPLFVYDSNDLSFYIPHSQRPTMTDGYTDGEKNYYLYHIGYFENFPLLFSTTKRHTYPTTRYVYGQSVTEESAQLIESTILDRVTVENSYTTSVTVGVEATLGIKDVESIGATLAVTDTYGSSTVAESSTVYHTASEWRKKIVSTLEQEFDADDPEGYYRYVRYAKRCEIYVLVEYDPDNTAKPYRFDYIALADPSSTNAVEMIEYSMDGNFESDRVADLTFNIGDVCRGSRYDDLAYRGPISLDVQRSQCADGSGYNKSASIGSGEAGDAVRHKDFELGHFVLYGCGVKDGTYEIVDPEEFKISYVVEQNPARLPCVNELSVSNDGATQVLGVELAGRKVGLGVCEVRIYYKNGELAQRTTKFDFFSEKTVGSTVNMMSAVNLTADPDRIARIEITLAYELYFYNGWFDHHHTNWRSDYVLTVE